MASFTITDLPGPAGSLQRARLYYPDGTDGRTPGGAVLDLALAESPAGLFGGSAVLDDTAAQYPGGYQYEVRQVATQSDAAFDASVTVTVERGDFYVFFVVGRYTDQAAVRTWLGTINADAMADLDGDDAPDAGAYQQSIEWGEDELDLYAGGGPGEVPFTYTGGTAGQQAVAQRTIGRWATVLSGWFLFYKRPAVQGNLLATPAAAQALATLDGAKRAVLDEIKQWRAGGLLLPGLTPATEAEDTPEPGQFQFVTIDRGNGCNGDENSSCW
jgi:hypothetical protein